MKLELVPALAQQQTLSPKLMVSMKMLPLTNLELEYQIQRELEENPALEVIEDSTPREETPAAPDRIADTLRLFQPFQDTTHGGRNGARDGEDYFASVPDTSHGLSSHLTAQLQFLDLPAEVRRAAEEIIGNLDARGYLTCAPEELAAYLPAQLTPHVETAFRVVQRLDPAGVGACDLRECLLLQCRRLGASHADAEKVLREHFKLLVQNRVPQLANALGWTTERINQAIETLARLSPRPGTAYAHDAASRVTPDAIIEEAPGGGWRVEVTDERLPRLQLSAQCRELLARKDLDAETHRYLKKKLESAQWLLQALDGRRRTLRSITEAILEHQSGFLSAGPAQLRPLKMQTIADAVGMHISTVSRAIKDKYLQTPWGTYPLRTFFGGGIADGAGHVTATRTLKQRIAEMIGREDKRAPLSDGEIAAKLRLQGFALSRRTVSKYRDSIHVPPASLRKAF